MSPPITAPASGCATLASTPTAKPRRDKRQGGRTDRRTPPTSEYSPLAAEETHQCTGYPPRAPDRARGTDVDRRTTDRRCTHSQAKHTITEAHIHSPASLPISPTRPSSPADRTWGATRDTRATPMKRIPTTTTSRPTGRTEWTTPSDRLDSQPPNLLRVPTLSGPKATERRQVDGPISPPDGFRPRKTPSVHRRPHHLVTASPPRSDRRRR